MNAQSLPGVQPGRRMATLALVALVHAALLAALLAAGTHFLARPVPSMSVAFIEAPRPRAEPPRPLPLRAPTPLRVELPFVPPPDIAVRTEAAPPTIRVDPRPATPLSVEPPARVTEVASPPRLEPPRADLAYLDNAAPPYPPISRRMREEGRVLLRVDVDPDGRVIVVELEKGSGHERLDEAALAAVRRWRFAPARLGDTKVAGRALVPVVFQLNG